jgi:polyvinyl alcohol dehydrogenase (cytochrome)
MRLGLLVALVVGGFAVSAAGQSTQSPSGDAVYQRRCAACHERPADGRTPSRNTLQAMTSTRILRTLDFGAMMTIAYQLNRQEREAVATFLGKPGGDAPPLASAFCRDRSVAIELGAQTWNGWSPSRDNARFAPAALAGLAAGQVPKLTLKWAFGFDGDISAFSQPTVIGKQVFVGSAGGVVHALRADTGCLQWTFQANGPIRSAIVAAHSEGTQLLLCSGISRMVLRAGPRRTVNWSGGSGRTNTKRFV